VDAPRALASSRSYARLAALGGGRKRRSEDGSQPPTPMPPADAARPVAWGPPAVAGPPADWAELRAKLAMPAMAEADAAGGEAEDEDDRGSVYLDAAEEEEERAGFISGGPGSSEGAGSGGSTGQPWGGDRERIYSTRLLLEQPSSFRAMQATEDAAAPPPLPPPLRPPRLTPAGGAAGSNGLLTSVSSGEYYGSGGGDDDSDLREIGSTETCCFCFTRTRRRWR
jgi:hypothetical protein